MFDRILVPLDGSAYAECVLPHASVLAQAFGSTVTLLHVLETERAGSPIRYLDPVQWRLEKSEAIAYLRSAAERLGDQNVTVEAVVREGCAPERIGELAHHYSLTLLSSYGYGGPRVWEMGSVVRKVLSSSGGSSMVVRAPRAGGDSETPLRYKRILVPLDGSMRAEAILPAAETLAQACDAQLIIAHIVCEPELPRRLPPSFDEANMVRQFSEHNYRTAAGYFEELSQRLSPKAEVRLTCAKSVTSALHSMVEEEGVDLLMLCAHGYSGDVRRMYGGVATNFISYGACSLLIMQDMPVKPARAATAVTPVRRQEVPYHDQ